MSDFQSTGSLPNFSDVAWYEVDHSSKRNILITKDMISKQLQRDGPKIASSFDRLTGEVVDQCSELLARCYGAILTHLVDDMDNGFDATAARLTGTSINSFIASVEVARHGFPLQYGMLSRGVHETMAVLLVLATEHDALAEFHAGRVKSTKCVTRATKILPHLGRLWGWFSDSFVHIGSGHANLDSPKLWKQNDDALDFVTQSMRHDAWLIFVVVELVFFTRFSQHHYWKQEGAGFVFSPDAKGDQIMDAMLLGR